VPTAEKIGVTIAVENVWNKFLLSPLEMRGFIDSFKSKRVGAYFDVGNVLLTGYPEQWIKILGKRIKRIHIKDFKKSVGTVDGFVDLLKGDVDFTAVKKALAAIGYKGYVTAEMIPYSPGRPERTARAMKKIFK
jgi:hexulose-6-phosphate isomerase